MKLTPLGKLMLFAIGLGLVVTGLWQVLPADLRTASGWVERTRSRVGGPGDPSASRPSAQELRLHGSNTIGRDLAPALAEKFLAQRGSVDARRRSPAAEEVVVEGHLPGQVEMVRIEIAAHGSSTAFESLASGKADIGLSSRRIRPEERQRLASLGDMTSAAAEHVLALDGVAIVVHRANPVDSLSLRQVRALFTGEISDWSAVGGSPGPVHLHARDDRSGTFDTFKTLVLGDAALASTARRYEDSRALAREVATDPRGLGFVGLAYQGETRAIKVSDEDSIAYRPTVFTIRTEDYLLTRRLFLYTAQAPSNPLVASFVEFALSDAGQRIVDSVGFVGQSLLAAPEAAASPPANAPPAYVTAVAGATRLPLTFRFESGSNRLDNKALRDVGRLLEGLSEGAHRNKRVLLLGFTDSLGGPEVNLRLSRERAAAVEQELIAEGIRPAVVLGFGPALPVATNDGEEGRSRNRRVEVWVR